MTSLSTEPFAGVFDHGWLAAVLPADARRFRVGDPALAPVLADAGGELVDRDADVEIAPAGELTGEAPLAVVSFAAPAHDSSSLAFRVARRLASAAHVRLKALRARRVVRRKGYSRSETVLWDVRQQFRVPGGMRVSRGLVELLPQRALVVGRRSSAAERTLLVAALDAAGARLEQPPSVRAGLVAALTDRGLLRVAVGPARRQLETQARALDALRQAGPDDSVAERVPWILAAGKTGLADWTLERRLPGTRAVGLREELLTDCIAFLVALYSAGSREPERVPSEDAAAIAEVRTAHAEQLAELGRRLDAELAPVARGFGHGDFFLGNLLVDAGQLTGVVDWDSGGPGRLPLLDLLHLLHLAEYPLGDEDWGPSLVEHMFPSARAGGDAAVRGYCEAVGLDPAPRVLEALAVAYWLDRAAYILETHRQRRTEPRWLERNVDHVLGALQGLA